MTKDNYQQINVRVTKEEKELLQAQAKNLKIKLSQYVRNRLLEESESKESEYRELYTNARNSIQMLETELKDATKKLENFEKNLEEIVKSSTFYTILASDLRVLEEKNDLLMAQLDEKRAEISDLKNDKTELYRLFDQQQQLIHGNKFALPAPKKSFWARLLGR